LGACFAAMNEASLVSSLHSRFYDCSPVQWVGIDMILVAVICSHSSRFNDCSAVQWVDIDMMLKTSNIWSQSSIFNNWNSYWYDACICYVMTVRKFNYSSPIQWVDIGMMLASVVWVQIHRFNDCSPAQYVDIDKLLASHNNEALMIAS
jgi:hypothetical protein